MPKNSNQNIQPIAWVDAEIRLAGMLDKRMIELLSAIDKTGSINQAAKHVGLSYKGAWQMIERANNLAPKVLIATATGGSKGGGTLLTPAGQALLRLYARLEYRHQQFLAKLNRDLLDDPETMILLKNMAVKSSASNQLFGQVSDFTTGAIHKEVNVRLKGGEHIVASMTNDEFDSLGLKHQDDVLLLIGTSEINIVTDAHPYRLSARNSLKGTVIRVQHDDVDAEVFIRLLGGESIVAMITRDSAESLILNPGDSVLAVFKSNAVILGTMTNTDPPVVVAAAED
jgi:molybdate transport system regulatory protein